MIYSKCLLTSLSFLTVGTVLAQNYKIVNANSGKVLDVTGMSTSDGALIQQWDWWGGANQQWQVLPLGNGYSQIVNVNSSKVLDVSDWRTDDGAPIQQWDWLGGANQQWQIVSQGSSYNSVANLNSGKVLDVTNWGMDDGVLIQQWDWLSGLNQQWEIVPVQDTYQVTDQTDMWYDPGSNYVYAEATTDQDYFTQYYYGGMIYTQILDNGVPVASGWWGEPQTGQTGFGVASAAVPGSPGDYYEAQSTFWLVTDYTVEQIISDCNDDCSNWYDPFDYNFLPGNPQGTADEFPFGMVWAAPIVVATAIPSQLVQLGNDGTGLTVPGNRDVFDLKVRSFIPAAWIWGAGFPWDFCVDSGGNVHKPIYQGDHRGFDPFSKSYRSHSEVSVSASSGSATTTLNNDPGTTVRYSDDALAPDGYTLISDTIYNDCHLTDKVVAGSMSANASIAGGGGIVTAELNGSATNMATTWGPYLTPSITWDVTYTIDTTSDPFHPPFMFDYTHDCFPAYESYIGSEFVYGFRPTSYGPVHIGLCLAGLSPESGSVSGAVY